MSEKVIVPSNTRLNSKTEIFQIFWIIFSFCFIFGFKYITPPAGLTQFSMQVLGLFLGMIILWLTVSVTWTSVLCLLLMSLLPNMKIDSVLASAFGNWLFPFLVCTFAITHTLSKTQFIRRCVLFIVTRKFAQKSPWQFIILYFSSVCLIGLFTSSTVLFVMFLPVTEEIFQELGLKPGDRTASMIILGLAMCCSISGATNPIHTFPLMALALYQRDTGIAINFASYASFGIVVGVVVLALMILVFKYIYRPDLSSIKSLNVNGLKQNLSPMDRKEKITLGVFGLVILFLLLPGIGKHLAPDFSKAIASYGYALPPMAGFVILSILRDKGKPILDFKDCMRSGVSWSAIFMACSVIALSNILTLENVGLVKYLTNAMLPLTQSLNSWTFILVILLWLSVQTSFSSDMVSLTVVYSVAMPLAMASGSINPAVLTCLIGAASTLALNTPTATAHVSIACGTNWLSLSDLFKYGTLMMIIIILVLLFIGYPLLTSLFPI